MVKMLADVGDGTTRDSGEVLERLHYGGQLPGILEHGLPGPEAKIQPIHGNGVPVKRLPKGSRALPRA